jgi:hypothetical protein
MRALAAFTVIQETAVDRLSSSGNPHQRPTFVASMTFTF